MKRKFWVLLVVGLLVFSATAVLAQEKKPVKMIGTAVLSGKLGAIQETGWGFMGGADFVNSHGGINGRKLQVIMEDGQYEIPLSVSIFNRIVAAEPKDELFFHSGWQTGVLHAIKEKVKENHVVCTDGSMSPAIFGGNTKEEYPYYFSMGVDYGDQTAMLCKYIKTKLHKGPGKPRLAFVYIESGVGREPIEKLRKYSEKFGIDLVLVEPVTFTQTDYTPTLMKVRQAKADYAILWSWSVPVATRFVKTARKIIPKTTLLSMSYAAWEIYFNTAKEDFDGIYVVSPYPRPAEKNNPLVAKCLDIIEINKQKVVIWDLYLQGFLMSLVNGEAAIRADKAGNLTREGCRDALENLTDWDMFGMYDGAKFNYGTHKFPKARILRADYSQKVLVPVTEWLEVEDYLK